jgi:7-cyano-7-deazaguanine synthase
MKSVVILSGGQDSATCLAMAIRAGEEVETLTFAYGQRHAIELNYASTLCRIWNVPNKRLHLPWIGELTRSALTDHRIDLQKDRDDGKPSAFVPARNALFLTIAHGYAQQIGARRIYLGVADADNSRFPDCKLPFLQSFENALSVGYGFGIEIYTPLAGYSKADIFQIAHNIGKLDDIMAFTHTCYEGERHEFRWGFGCGKCSACKARANGWAEFMKRNPQ